MISRPALRYFGGKFILADWIISHFPKHRVYVEPFGGAMSVLLNKPRCYAEVYNDLDGQIVSFFRVLQSAASARILFEKLNLTPFARDEFLLAKEFTDDPIENARRMIIRSFMGFGADSTMDAGKSTGFRSNSSRSGTTPAHDWSNYPRAVLEICERLSGVVIENKHYAEVMSQQDGAETLFYLDPPYVHESRTRARTHQYNHEMSNADHELLLEKIQKLHGMVILSGYPNSIYNRLKWHQVKRSARADGAGERTEILWINERARQGANQLAFEVIR